MISNLKFPIEIKIEEGFNDLEFGATMDEVRELLGEPEEVEELNDEEEEGTVAWHYWTTGITLFFEEIDEARFACAEIDNNNTSIFGEMIFYKTDKEIIDIFRKNGYDDFEFEDLGEGEKRVTVLDAIIDLYFEDDKLMSVNFGILFEDYDEDEFIFRNN